MTITFGNGISIGQGISLGIVIIPAVEDLADENDDLLTTENGVDLTTED